MSQISNSIYREMLLRHQFLFDLSFEVISFFSDPLLLAGWLVDRFESKGEL